MAKLGLMARFGIQPLQILGWDRKGTLGRGVCVCVCAFLIICSFTNFLPGLLHGAVIMNVEYFRTKPCQKLTVITSITTSVRKHPDLEPFFPSLEAAIQGEKLWDANACPRLPAAHTPPAEMMPAGRCSWLESNNHRSSPAAHSFCFKICSSRLKVSFSVTCLSGTFWPPPPPSSTA